MQLLPERVVTYTLPIASAALQIVDEYEKLKSDSDSERLAELAAQLPTVTQLRLTVRQVSALRQGQYEALRVEAAQLVKELTGRDSETILTDRQSVTELAFLMDAFNAACMLASLVKVEESNYSYGQSPVDWKVIELPAEWRTLRDFLDWIPPRSGDGSDSPLLVWTNAALEVNPELWLRRTDDSAKKFGAASVN